MVPQICWQYKKQAFRGDTRSIVQSIAAVPYILPASRCLS